MTDLVSRRLTSFSLIPLNRTEIADDCKMGVHDCDELKSLHNFVLKNIDRRLSVYDGTSLTTLRHPSTKSLVNMTAQEKEDLIYNAVTERPHDTDTVQQLPQSAESRFSEIFPTRSYVSKKNEAHEGTCTTEC